ncbi:hypothetical protein M9458_031713, partial [Cirrhinus mrigala]
HQYTRRMLLDTLLLFQAPFPKGHIQDNLRLLCNLQFFPVTEYTWYSIFTMLCCCFPLGTAALVYSLS